MRISTPYRDLMNRPFIRRRMNLEIRYFPLKRRSITCPAMAEIILLPFPGRHPALRPTKASETPGNARHLNEPPPARADLLWREGSTTTNIQLEPVRVTTFGVDHTS